MTRQAHIRFQCLAAVLLLGLSRLVAADPVLEGTGVELGVVVTLPDPVSGNRWQDSYGRKGSSFLRLHFAGFTDQGGGDFRVEVKDADFQTQGVYSRADFAEQKEFWSAIVPADTVSVIVSPADPANPPKIRFLIDRLLYEAKGAKVLSISGPDQRRWLLDYKSDAALMKAAASVAKLVFMRDGSGYTCSGFMVSDNLMMSNRHCVSSASECKSAVAVFGYEYGEDRRIKTGGQYRCAEVVRPGSDDLDYALLRLAGDPGSAARYGSLPLKAQDAAQGAPLVMIQHPYGEPKQVSRDDCAITTPAAPSMTSATETDFGHSCDTLNGSSGSPLLNDRMEVVGLHHLGFDLKSTRWGRENRAVKMQLIIEDAKAVLPKSP